MLPITNSNKTGGVVLSPVSLSRVDFMMRAHWKVSFKRNLLILVQCRDLLTFHWPTFSRVLTRTFLRINSPEITWLKHFTHHLLMQVTSHQFLLLAQTFSMDLLFTISMSSLSSMNASKLTLHLTLLLMLSWLVRRHCNKLMLANTQPFTCSGDTSKFLVTTAAWMVSSELSLLSQKSTLDTSFPHLLHFQTTGTHW